MFLFYTHVHKKVVWLLHKVGFILLIMIVVPVLVWV